MGGGGGVKIHATHKFISACRNRKCQTDSRGVYSLSNDVHIWLGVMCNGVHCGDINKCQDKSNGITILF